eukprot:scaffold460239_cov86-Attheya_sp.AAC.1
MAMLPNIVFISTPVALVFLFTPQPQPQPQPLVNSTTTTEEKSAHTPRSTPPANGIIHQPH